MTLAIFMAGMVAGIICAWLWSVKNSKNIKIHLSEYFLIALLTTVLIAGIVFVKTFIEESEPDAAVLSGVLSSLLALLLLGTTWQLIKRHNS
ncbi:dehalogenase [Dehalococcoides mccartyi CG1]|jgi:fructose-specific phosphotransferase system IIC component|uniref:hypothetical protein n=1 Tax=Dehalococcoides mccartyi TaxID=61435 RepID=UPI0004E055F8|nr:hypothetical protein [Dehalococcoides mccartyi]AII58463.1 dehalogenase [Dehalococcoides mccartyi CG1]